MARYDNGSGRKLILHLFKMRFIVKTNLKCAKECTVLQKIRQMWQAPKTFDKRNLEMPVVYEIIEINS